MTSAPIPDVPLDVGSPAAVAAALEDRISGVVRGKTPAVRLALVALLSGGHLLIEDVPGTGKTLLARTLAAVVGGRFQRVQCTPDLLPSDLTGTTVFRANADDWEFRPGPVFANVVLVDEINRASPRTQAALLEPMEEHQVTVDGRTHRLPDPFFCVATQNPLGQAGTFPLPESQLDRFAIVTTLGMPSRDAEREILTGVGGVPAMDAVTPVTTVAGLRAVRTAVRAVHCAGSVVDYVLDVAAATRADPHVEVGASPRAALGLLHAARAHATIVGRDFVSPDDVKAVTGPALAHRIVLGGGIDVAAALGVLHRALLRVDAPAL